MVSRAEANRFMRANNEIARQIKSAISRTWIGLGAMTVEGKRDALLDILPGLVNRYGQTAEAVAAEYFERTTGVPATMIDWDFTAQVQGSLRYSIGSAFSGREAEAVAGIAASMTRHALQHGRSTIYQSSRSTPGVRFARAPDAKACDWCRIMASRGAVYLTEETAGGEGNSYHDDCGCVPVAIRDGDTLPYDADALYAEYKDAWDVAGGTGVQAGAVARAMRAIRAEK